MKVSTETKEPKDPNDDDAILELLRQLQEQVAEGQRTKTILLCLKLLPSMTP